MIAYIKGWQLSLVLTACIPCILIVMGIMAKMIGKTSTREQTANAEAGNVVQQTVGAIRTVRHTRHF